MPPESWKNTKLGDYAKVIMGQSPESDYYTTDPKDVPFLQGNRTFGFKYPSFDTYTRKITRLAPCGSVIVSVRAPVGDTNLAPVDLCIGRGVAALTSTDPDNEYLYYLVKYLVPLLNQNENGTTFGSINKSDLCRLPFLLPDYRSRAIIAGLLSLIDNEIRTCQAINDNLLRLMELLFDHWIGKQSDRSKELSLYDFSKITYGAPFSSSLFNQNGIGYPLIRIRDLKTNSPQFSTDEQHPRLTYINPGDILIGMDAEFKPHVWIGEKGVLNQRVCRLEPVDEKICPYLPLLLIRDKLEFIESYKSGTTVSHIGKEDFDQMTINSPPVSEMIEFSKTINPIYSMYISNGIEVRRLSQLRDLLLPKLMSGEIDVSTLKMPTKYSFGRLLGYVLLVCILHIFLINHSVMESCINPHMA